MKKGNPDWVTEEEKLGYPKKTDGDIRTYWFPSSYDSEVSEITGTTLHSDIVDDVDQKKLLEYLSEQTGEDVIEFLHRESDDGMITVRIKLEEGKEKEEFDPNYKIVGMMNNISEAIKEISFEKGIQPLKNALKPLTLLENDKRTKFDVEKQFNDSVYELYKFIIENNFNIDEYFKNIEPLFYKEEEKRFLEKFDKEDTEKKMKILKRQIIVLNDKINKLHLELDGNLKGF